jgi:hypothetical protein
MFFVGLGFGMIAGFAFGNPGEAKLTALRIWAYLRSLFKKDGA